MRTQYILAAAIFAAAIISISCSSHHEKSDDNGTVQGDQTWVGMDQFHLVMAECFHPYKDSSNLEPAKRLAGELATEAKNWAASPIPSPVDNDEMKGMLNNLVASTSKFQEQVAGADDAVIKDALSEIHDEFHHIQEAWYNARNGSHTDHH